MGSNRQERRPPNMKRENLQERKTVKKKTVKKVQRSPTDVRGESPSGRVAAVRLQIECPGKQFPCAARGGKMLARSRNVLAAGWCPDIG